MGCEQLEEDKPTDLLWCTMGCEQLEEDKPTDLLWCTMGCEQRLNTLFDLLPASQHTQCYWAV